MRRWEGVFEEEVEALAFARDRRLVLGVRAAVLVRPIDSSVLEPAPALDDTVRHLIDLGVR